MKDRQIHIKQIKSNLDQRNKDIDDLEIKLKSAPDEIKSEYEKELISLREMRDEAVLKLEEIQNTTDSAWEYVKDGFDRTWHSINRAAKSAKHRVFAGIGSGRDN